MSARSRDLVQRLDQRASPDLSDALENLARAFVLLNEHWESGRAGGRAAELAMSRWTDAMIKTDPSEMEQTLSPLQKQAADALRRARRLPLGADRNDLRQLAFSLLWLDRNGMDALVERRRRVWHADDIGPRAP